MGQSRTDPFKEFFTDSRYLSLKNHLYNYLLRKRAIERRLQTESVDMVLEVGTGISPAVTYFKKVVYTDISLAALQTLKQTNNWGYHVVADGISLPFKSDSFSHVVCSEVLEHIESDEKVLGEAARVLRRSGSLILTFPHRKAFFAIDDRFVGHLRRYELGEMVTLLDNCGLRMTFVQKVLGPLEKATMILVTWILSVYRAKEQRSTKQLNTRLLALCLPVFSCFNKVYAVFLRIEVCMTPQRLSSVLLLVAVKL
jgi:ubiquinone/menaquinone biosynthesis C-methylase UbiE